MKLLVIGHARHGKDTLCEILRDRYGLKFESSSRVACREFLYETSKDVGRDFGSPEELYERRGEVRAWMHDEIRRFNDPDLTRLARLILDVGNDIYCGMRSREELEACKAAGLFDVVIWVDRSEHLPPESADSMKLTKEDADIVFDNNGTLEELRVQADVLMCMARMIKVERAITPRLDQVFDTDKLDVIFERMSA